jgi:hypothetical protein
MSDQLKARFAKVVDDLLAGKKPETMMEELDRVVGSDYASEAQVIPLIAYMESEMKGNVDLLRDVFQRAGLRRVPRLEFNEQIAPYDSRPPSRGMMVTGDKSRVYVSAIVDGPASYFTVFEQKTSKPRGGERWGADTTAEDISVNIDHAFEVLFTDTVAGRSRRELSILI